jgi:hypothetical protein
MFMVCSNIAQLQAPAKRKISGNQENRVVHGASATRAQDARGSSTLDGHRLARDDATSPSRHADPLAAKTSPESVLEKR